MEPGDYVVSTTGIKDIPASAVGVVSEIHGDKVLVSFIGLESLVETEKADVAYLNINKTGKGYPKKICNICHLLKDTDEFEINQTDARGNKTTRPSCKVCRISINGTSLSSEERNRLNELAPKGIYTCEICEKRGIAGITAKYVRDHCHTTGKGRGWICDSCNTGLGRFKDNITLLQKAIDYLKQHQ
jgi:hypothetical protein